MRKADHKGVGVLIIAALRARHSTISQIEIGRLLDVHPYHVSELSSGMRHLTSAQVARAVRTCISHLSVHEMLSCFVGADVARHVLDIDVRQRVRELKAQRERLRQTVQ